jgi:CheY-like chemotaxis protein
MELGELVKKIREYYDMEVKEMSIILDISEDQLKNIENLKTKNPGYKTLVRLRDKYGISIDRFLDGFDFRMIMRDFRILLIDDHENSRLLMRKALQRLGCRRVEHTGSIKEASELLTKGGYDFVILDNIMPDINGIDFMAQIPQRIKESTFFIMLTAHANFKLIKKFAMVGGHEFFNKPVDFTELIAAMEELYSEKFREAQGKPKNIEVLH